MKRVQWILETGFAGENHEGELDIDDNITDEEIEAMVYQEVCNYINWSWWVVDGECETKE